jgi:Tfp pilus assembly protein PilF
LIRLLEATVQQWPRALAAHVLLSHALLQEGKDLAAAEVALRQVLALDPGHAEAHHNLALVLHEQKRLASHRAEAPYVTN